jgi:hypothetical protein
VEQNWLFHFSEEADIEVFEPRAPLARPEVTPMVWAVDSWHAPHFYLPRDCPRVCFWSAGSHTKDEADILLAGSERVVAIEPSWRKLLGTTKVYRYVFEPSGFELLDVDAGYYVKREAVRPVKVGALGDLAMALVAAGVTLRFDSELFLLHDRVMAAGLRFSSMRLQNVHLLNK